MKKKKKYIKKSKGCYLGNIDKNIKRLKEKMELSSNNQEFEKAIELRDKIINLERAGKKQKVSNFLHKSIDVIGIAGNNLETHLTIFEVRGSNLDNKKTIILKDVEDIEEEEIIENYIMQTYGASDNILDISYISILLGISFKLNISFNSFNIISSFLVAFFKDICEFCSASSTNFNFSPFLGTIISTLCPIFSDIIFSKIS